MNRKNAGITASALLVTAVLAGCGSGGETGTETPQETTAPRSDNPELTVYDTPTPERINFVLNPGQLDAGTKVRVSAYNGGFENAAPGCNGEETTGTELNVSERGELTGTLNQPGVGNVRLVITAPGYSSSCEGTENTLAVKWLPEVIINANDNKPGAEPIKTPAPGEEFTVSVGTNIERQATFKDSFTENMTIEAHGPYTNVPELQAAGCPDDAPIAATLTAPYEYAKAGQGLGSPPALSIQEPGAYWFSVTIQGGERSAEAIGTTCDGDVSEGVVIVE